MVKKLVRLIFSGEFIFAAFLLSSVFKSALDDIILFDTTVIFMLFSGFIALKRIIKNGKITKIIILPFILFFMLATFMLISYIYSISESYALDKSIRFFFLTGWSFIGIFILVPNKDSLMKFLNSIVLITSLTSFYVIFQYLSSPEVILGYTRFGVDGENVIGLARISGLASIITLLLFIYKKTNFFMKIFGILFTSLFVTTLLLTGSRMPLLALIISISLSLFLSLNLEKKSIKFNKGGLILAVLVALFILILFLFYDNSFMETSMQRIISLFESDASTLERLYRMEFAKEMFINNPIFGNGVGSYAVNFSGVDLRDYPHNIFLEILAELGVTGFILFSLLFIFGFLILLKGTNRALTVAQIVVIVSFVYLLINANVSGDINDNRIMYSFLALVILLNQFRNIKEETR